MRMKCLSTSMIGWVQWNSTMGFIWLGLKIGCTNPLVDHNFLMKWPSTVVPYFQTRPATKLAGLHLCSRPTRFTSNGFSTQEAHTVAARHWEWDSEDAVWCYRCCFCFVAPWSCEMILGVKALTPGIYYTYCYSIYYIYYQSIFHNIYIYTHDIMIYIYIYYQSIFHYIYIYTTLWYIYICMYVCIYICIYDIWYFKHSRSLSSWFSQPDRPSRSTGRLRSSESHLADPQGPQGRRWLKLPSGKVTVCYGKSQFWMVKSC